VGRAFGAPGRESGEVEWARLGILGGGGAGKEGASVF